MYKYFFSYKIPVTNMLMYSDYQVMGWMGFLKDLNKIFW